MKAFSTNYARGMAAEFYAALFLMLKGYRIRAWRYKTPVGEVDLIASRNGKLVFVEVKLRPTAEEGLAAVTPVMRSRIGRAASHFLSAHQAGKQWKTGVECRFDVIAISGFRVYHLDNAWFHTT